MRLKKLFQPRSLRLLALGFILFGSLLLLWQSYYGETVLVAQGKVRWAPDQTVLFAINSSVPGGGPEAVSVTLTPLLRISIQKWGEEAEFLAVINRLGDKLIFERLILLEEPAEAQLRGPNSGGAVTLAVGTKPELVQMVGLDRYGYRLVQPAWARKKMPGADRVYYQAGTFEPVKKILEGGGSFQPNLYILDEKSRVVGIRRLGASLATFPQFLRWAALVFYSLAPVSLLGAFIFNRRRELAKLGRRIWDQVSRRGRKASN